MNRREVLRMAGAAPLLLPAFAAGRAVRTIGYLSGGAGSEEIGHHLARLGHVEGTNLRFIVRKPAPGLADIDAMAGELVRAAPDVLLAFGPQRTAALFAATRTIPIVCGVHPDPVRAGLARSLARPGLNVTGLSSALSETAHLILGTLRALRPRLRLLTTIHARDYRGTLVDIREPMRAEAERAGIATRWLTPASVAELEAAIASVRDPEAEAVSHFTLPEVQDPRVTGGLLLRHRVVAHSSAREVVEHGATFFSRLSWSEEHRMRRTAELLDKVLRGTPPADIPFEMPDRLDFLLNRRVAATLGVEIPADVLLRATEVIG